MHTQGEEGVYEGIRRIQEGTNKYSHFPVLEIDVYF